MNRLFDGLFGLPGTVVVTTLLSLTALVMALFFPSLSRWVRVPAMLLGSVGDLILMNNPVFVTFLPKSFRNFIGGGIFFMLGHLIYLVSFMIKNAEAGLPILNRWFWVGPAAGVLIFASFAVMQTLSGKHDLFFLFMLGLVYFMVECLVLGVTLSYAVQTKTLYAWVAVIGSVAFIASDYFIGLSKLTPYAPRNSNVILWWLYPIGQLLLLIG